MAVEQQVIVTGGGWAGLAAAVELSSAGLKPILLESSPQLGGRARTVDTGSWSVDNGQHLLIGGYRETLRLMDCIGVNPKDIPRSPLHLCVNGPMGAMALTAPALPAPLHLAWALLAATGLSLHERLHAVALSLRLYVSGFALEQDCTVLELLQRHKQGERLIELLWQPLCLGALNTPVAAASARVFLRVLQDSFAQRRRDSDLIIPATGLSALFADRARDFIESRGGQVLTSSTVTGLIVENGNLRGVRHKAGVVACNRLILATPFAVSRKLLAAHDTFQPISEQLARLQHAPITTVYLQYDAATRLDTPMYGMSGTLTQWLFDRRVCGQPGLMAAVISGDGDHMAMSRQALADTVTQELASHFPQWPAPRQALVIREKHATFHCGPGIERFRPAPTTPVVGCWLAGDYTDTGYPATLEGAVRSGVQCAQLIINQTTEK